jgi:hypothetical protein
MYDEWLDLVYGGAPKRQWFERYTRRFDTVELNAVSDATSFRGGLTKRIDA